VEPTVREAKTYITAALRHSYRVGAGHSPVHHFHAWWAGDGDGFNVQGSTFKVRETGSNFEL
jgi:hydroxymethylpyrimidine/phosphomethylpyrimidine kinase